MAGATTAGGLTGCWQLLGWKFVSLGSSCFAKMRVSLHRPTLFERKHVFAHYSTKDREHFLCMGYLEPSWVDQFGLARFWFSLIVPKVGKSECQRWVPISKTPIFPQTIESTCLSRVGVGHGLELGNTKLGIGNA